MQGVRDLQIFQLYGEEKDAGNVSAPFFPSNGAHYLVYAIGTDVVGGSGPYTHTISESNTLSSMTIEKNIGNSQSLQFAGCRIGKYTLKAQTGNNEANFTAEVTAQSAAILSSPSAIVVTNESPFVFAEVTVQWNSFTYANLTNFTIEIDNGLKPTYTFNQSHQLQFLTPNSLHVSGSFDAVYDSLNDTNYGFFTFASVSKIAASLTFTLAHTSPAYGVVITCPKVVLSKTDQQVKVNDVVMETINFEAQYDLGGTNKTISAVITNGVSTQY